MGQDRNRLRNRLRLRNEGRDEDHNRDRNRRNRLLRPRPRARPEGFSNRRARTVVSEFHMYEKTPLYFEYLKAVR